jgi:hypothetical protein
VFRRTLCIGAEGKAIPVHKSRDMGEWGWLHLWMQYYRGADKSLARPGRKQDTVTEDFDVHISCLLS